MINPTQISSGIKTVSKMVSKPEIVNNIAEKAKVSEKEVMQHLSSMGTTNKAVLDVNAIQQKLRKELISTRNTDLVPIESAEEYKAILERIKNSPFGQKIKEDIQLDYQDINSIEEGLLSYCGNHADIHSEINKYLSGRGNPENEPLMKDIIRALDFSLKDLDKKYGKFDGFVFRQGVMKNGEHQFWSTAESASSAGNFSKAWNTPEEILDREYSVIKTKSGHKITEFQKAHKNKYIAEEEILLPREKDFRLVPQEEYTEEMLNAREKMLNNLFQHNNKMWKKLQKGQTVSLEKRVQNKQTGQVKYETVDVDIDYLRNMIRVFEEI